MKNFGEFFNNQVETAKCIVLSHTDGLSEEKLHECIHLLKEKNNNATIVSTPWDELTPMQIVDAIEGASSIDKEMEELKEDAHHHEHHECCEHHHHEHHHKHNHECCEHHHEHHHHHDGETCSCGHDHGHHHHHADEVFQSVGVETAKKFTVDEITAILSKLDNEEKYGTILRAKGYVASNDEWIYFDYIPGTPDVRRGSADICGRICVIGADINADAIKELFGV